MLEGEAIDRALAAMGDFADLVSPYLAGSLSRSGGAGERGGAAVPVRRGRVTGIAARGARARRGPGCGPGPIWQKPGPLTAGEWERVRLHPYHSERILCRSPFLAALDPGRNRPPRAARRLGLPPRCGRRLAHAGCAAARRGRRLPRDDRAAPAPRGALPRAGRRRRSAMRPAPAGSTPTPSARCSRRPGTRPRGSSGRRV